MASIIIDAPAEVGHAQKRNLGRNPVLMALAAIAIAAVGIIWLTLPPSSETTDNAYLKADSSEIAPTVGGLIAAVLVKDNQPVRAGDPIVRIDPQEFDARVAAARAVVADADAGVATAQASIAALAADERLADARVRAAQSSIQAADAEYVRAAADRARFDALMAQGFATRRDAERIGSTAVSAASARDRTQAERDVTSEQVAVTQARLPVLRAALAQARATAARARAALDLALQDQRHSIVTAPVAGIVGNRQVQVGDFVQPGTRLVTLVPATPPYVVANFKETQVRRMAIGQKARISVDALGSEPLTGRVDSLAPASGSEFTLLPFEPGSGNFTKIVQRVGVRIALDPGQAALARLRPGLSVTATVSLR